MFQPYTSISEDEDYYVNLNKNICIESVLHAVEMMVHFRSGNNKTKKMCIVFAEKQELKNVIQLRLTEKCDQRKMYITTVDSASFQQIKEDQSLHVTFSGFIDNLMHLIKECLSANLEIYLVQGDESHTDMIASGGRPIDTYQLQFVEIRPFKNLIHLCLPCRIAPLNVVLFYMSSNMDALQKKLLLQEQSIDRLNHEIRDRNQRIEKLDSDCIENMRCLNKKHAEEILALQEKLSKCTEQTQRESERSKNTIRTLKQQNDELLGKNSALQTEKAYEQKRNEILSEELTLLKTKMSTLRESNGKLHSEITTLKNLERKHEMHLQDSRKEIIDLKDTLKKYDKNKAELIAELEAEKKISQTKRQALEIATDEISKANQIILKHTHDLNKLKKAISWRTEIALQQEQTIKSKDIHIKQRDEQIIFLKQNIEQLRNEIPKELDSIRKFATELDAKYTQHIRSLHLKLSPLEKENQRNLTNTAVRN